VELVVTPALAVMVAQILALQEHLEPGVAVEVAVAQQVCQQDILAVAAGVE
jgi:hypothetical protein